MDAYARAGDASSEVFSSIRSIAAYGGEKHEVKRYDTYLAKAQAAGTRKGLSLACAVGSLMFFIFGLYAVGMYVGAVLIINSRNDNPDCRIDPLGNDCFTGGDVIQTFMAIFIGAMSIGQAGPNFTALGTAKVAAYKIYSVINISPDIDIYSSKGEKPDLSTVQGRIEFRNVTFAYPTRPTEPVLSNFSIIVEPGENLALVGESGSGKSTIIQLLERYYDPQKGSILVDGIDIRDWNLAHLRKCLGLVSQEPQLFAASIRENISYGSDDPANVPEDRIIACAKTANAHRFITQLPEGYDTMAGISVTATQLSGGQRQRICIARALVKDPRILLLDEATSALDNESERIVQAAIDDLLEGRMDAVLTSGTKSSTTKRTSIIIAHRLSTITRASRICVLRKGVIVEQGTHAELMAIDDGLYKKMRELQEVSLGSVAQSSYETGLSVHEEVWSQSSGGSENPTEVSPHDSNSPDSPDGADATTRKQKSSGLRKNGKKVNLLKDKKDCNASQLEKEGRYISPEEREKMDIEEKKQLPPVPASRVWKLQAPEWPFIIIALVGSIASGIIQPVFGIIYSDMITILFDPNDDHLRSAAAKYAGYFIAIALGIYASTFMRIGGFIYLGEKLTRRLRGMAYQAMIRQPMSFFDDEKNSVGRLNTRLSQDAALVKGGTGEAVGTMLQTASAIIAALVIAFVASWRLALVVGALMPFLILGHKLRVCHSKYVFLRYFYFR